MASLCRAQLSLHSTISRRFASQWSHQKFPAYFVRTPVPRFSARRVLWIIPIVGGITLYLFPQPKSWVTQVMSSPSVIPCRPQSKPPNFHVIMSPLEGETTMKARLTWLFQNRLWEPLLTATRFLYLSVIFLPVILSSPMLLIGVPEASLAGDRWGAVWWYDLLVSQMQIAGPTFIKLAQWAASRADLFPALLCEKLGKLHSNGRPHSMAHTRRVIEKVFERRFEDIFEEFSETPIGTGAIAQVYRGTLKRDLIPPSYLGPRRHKQSAAAATILQEALPSVPTNAVAIKVLHPRVSKNISRDLSIMKTFAQLINIFPGMHWLSLPEEVQVFGEMMFQQLDLRHEAENLLTFESNFAPRRVPVNFPRPLQVWSTRDLLIEEFQNALPLEVFMLKGGGSFEDEVATIGLDAFLNMLLLDNFVHSDLHPGNIMIKFSKPPSTQDLLKSLYLTLHKHLFFSSATKYVTQVPLDDAASDAIVDSLKIAAKADDRSVWLSKLDEVATSGYIPEVVFIDAGLVTTLSARNRENFLELFRAIAEFDGYRAGQLMVARSRTPELAIDTETFALKMQHLILSVKRKTFSLGHIKISDILTDVLKNVRKHHVKMEGDFINTVISVLLLEGIGRQLDPDLDLFKSALPILRKLGSQMATEGGASMDLPSSNLGAFLKVWAWMEAREFISASIVNADDLVRYDWLCSSV